MNPPFYLTVYIYSRLSVSIHFKSMLRFTTPRSIKNLIFPNRFRSISRQTLLNSPRFLSQPSFSSPIVPGVLCSYRNRSVSRRTSSPTIVASGLRSDRAMATQSSNPQSVYDFTVKDARGNDVELSKFKGKVLLIVNVASQCGFTNSNYPELTQLYQKYKDQGFEVLAFPSNQFGGQEPGTNEEIEKFVCTRFKAEYPIFDKVDVNGSNASPLYKFLKSSKGGLLGDGIKWNFTKFLVDKEGNVIDRYAPTTTPLSIEKDIKKALGV